MSDGKESGGDAIADLQDLARRFQDLWRDQMAATAADPEFMEMMRSWMATFAPGGGQPPGAGRAPAMMPGPAGAMDPAAWMTAMLSAMMGVAAKGGANDAKTGATQAGAAAAADASGAGDVPGDEFEHRLAALEQRLDRLEAAAEGKGGGTAKRTSRRKS
jgi:hypothetical protein